MKYKYNAYTTARRVKSGTIDAASEEAALQALLQNGFQRVLTLQETALTDKRAPGGFLARFSITDTDVMEFTRELSYLLEAGVSIYSALQLLSRQTRKQAMKAIIEDIAASLNTGKPFSDAISKYPGVFSSMYCEVIKTVEKSGELNTGLEYLAEYIEKQESVKKRIRRALTYPAVVVAFAMCIGVLLATVILPPLVRITAANCSR